MSKMAKWPKGLEGQRARGPKGFEQNFYKQNGKMARGPKGYEQNGYEQNGKMA
jgi:hypothetical protein